MGQREYLSCADTAKLLRKALRESFPGVKFSVRSHTYAGGASIDVRWTDGPTVGMVKPVTGLFAGGYFDGMIDYKGSRYHRLDGKPVHLGADFIFEHRQLTQARAQAIADHFAAKWGRSDWLEVEGGEYFGYSVRITREAPYISPEVEEYDQATCGVNVKPSATLARLADAGDDGYGMGTTGSEANGWQGGQGYAGVGG